VLHKLVSLYVEAKPYHEISLLPETYVDINVRLNNFMGLSSSKLGQRIFRQTISPFFMMIKHMELFYSKLEEASNEVPPKHVHR